MQIYNCDEIEVSVVHKPGKVVAEMDATKFMQLHQLRRGKRTPF